MDFFKNIVFPQLNFRTDTFVEIQYCVRVGIKERSPSPPTSSLDVASRSEAQGPSSREKMPVRGPPYHQLWPLLTKDGLNNNWCDSCCRHPFFKYLGHVTFPPYPPIIPRTERDWFCQRYLSYGACVLHAEAKDEFSRNKHLEAKAGNKSDSKVPTVKKPN